MKKEFRPRGWSGLIRRPPRSEVDEELAFHVEERTRQLVASGMGREEAEEEALKRFGDLQAVRRECVDVLAAERRTEVRRARLRLSLIDVKLGIRLLLKYPGLTIVGGLAMAFAIWVGAAGFEVVNQIVRPTLPLPEGDRVVGLRLVPGAGGVDEAAFHQAVLQTGSLRSVEDVGAFRSFERNLMVDGDRSDPVDVAEMTASGFRLTRTAPLMGRVFDASDEVPGAPPVLVVGHAEWQNRFGGDPALVGRTVRLGREQVTVVGVMPPGFAFPVVHGFWMPLRPHALSLTGGSNGTGLTLFGRLAPGSGLREAGAELTVLAARVGAPSLSSDGRPAAEVLHYPRMINNVNGPEAAVMLLAVNVSLVMLLILACGNVALLMFARAVTRERELAVRSALGASRARITLQLFAEALLLAGVAATMGLMASRTALRRTLDMMAADSGPLPFWFDARLGPGTLLYTVALTVLAAAIAGVFPALKVTGRDVGRRLNRSSGAGHHQLRGIWTAVVVAQVAVTLVFPATAFFAYRYVGQIRQMDVGFPSHQYLTATLELDPASPFDTPPAPTGLEREGAVDAVAEALKRRLVAEPGVAGVTFASHLPRSLHGMVRVEAEGVSPGDDGSGVRVARALVDLEFFEVFDAPILAGRAFGPADLGVEPVPIIVNRAFADQVFEGRNPVGSRVRGLAVRREAGRVVAIEPGEWHEVVGLVEDLGVLLGGMDPTEGPGFYQPALPRDLAPLRVAVRTVGDPPEVFAPRLRFLAGTVDPALRLESVLPLDEAGSHMWLEMQFFSRLLMITSAMALLLSLAAIYSVTAFAVSRRTRELGVRVALGADPWRILRAVLMRPLLQVGLGIIAGSLLVGLIAGGFLEGAVGARQILLIGLYAVAMLLVCVLACVVPVRRALRIQPTEAMRAEV